MIVCVFGDSITWGAFDEDLGGWVNRLKLHFESKMTDEEWIEIYNLGVAGDKLVDLLKRFKSEAEARKPEALVFAIGINDSIHESHPTGTPFQEFSDGLRNLVDQAKEFSSNITFLGLTPVDEATDKSQYRNESIGNYEQLLNEFCEKNSIPIITLLEKLMASDLADGLHPNAAGHTKIFKEVQKGFKI